MVIPVYGNKCCFSCKVGITNSDTSTVEAAGFYLTPDNEDQLSQPKIPKPRPTTTTKQFPPVFTTSDGCAE